MAGYRYKKYKYSIEKYTASATRYVYGVSEDGEELYVRIHMPAHFEGKCPVLVSIHGGGWIGYTPEDTYSMWGATIDHLNEAGIAYVETYYRLASEKNRYPKLMMDCMDALDWVARDPEGLGFDRERIALTGGSAGGHLILMTAFAQDVYPKEGRQKVNVRAIVDCNGPVDLRQIEENHWNEGIREVLEITFGKTYQEAPEAYAEFSPIFHMDKVEQAPDLLIIHGDRDDIVPIEQSCRLRDEAVKRGWNVKMHVLHNAGHDFLPNGYKSTKPCFSSIFTVTEDFLAQKLLGREHLKG